MTTDSIPPVVASCKTCRYWLRLPVEEDVFNVRVGHCRRYAPKGGFPRIGQDQWCGEHKPL